MSLEIALLDVPRHAGDPTGAIATSWDLVERADTLGYARYWFAEHHGIDSSQSSPELSVAIAAGVTGRIRVGSGGVLLGIRSPLRVAEDFNFLSALYPGRVDLGLARGHPGLAATLFERDFRAPRTYEEKVGELLRLFSGAEAIRANPTDVAVPQIWLLGSNERSMQLAAKYGLAFCLSQFLEGASTTPLAILEQYRDRFQPSEWHAVPTCTVAVAGICASDERIIRDIRNRPETALRPTIVGGPARWLDELSRLAEGWRCTEIVVVDMSVQRAHRMEFVENIADAFGLASSASPKVASDTPS